MQGSTLRKSRNPMDDGLRSVPPPMLMKQAHVIQALASNRKPLQARFYNHTNFACVREQVLDTQKRKTKNKTTTKFARQKNNCRKKL